MKAVFRSTALLFCSLALLSGCSGSGPTAAYEQCVPYARNLSGIQIYGNAHEWWHKSARQGYPRGSRPWRGAVLVLAKNRRLRYGHIAVVNQVFDSRTITVSHANWGKDYLGRGLIYENMRVIDVSKLNDWTRVRFQSGTSNAFGSVYPAKGFIYPKM